MRVSLQVKEKIGHTLGSYFVTNKIVDIFNAANIPADKSLSAKWRIAVDAFNKISDEEAFFYILNAFCHPLNFEDREKRLAFINELKTALAYEDITVQINDRDVLFTKTKNDRESYVYYETPKREKTSIDYIIEAINFFKKEYNKVKIPGLTYEYCVGEMYGTHDNVEYSDDYQSNLDAINHLVEAGIIREYKAGAIQNDSGIWATVKCKINEDKLMQKEAPQATVEAEKLAQKIVHEHTHKFENSIQEKPIDLNHKIVQEAAKATGKTTQKINLKSVTIDYDDDKATLTIGEKNVSLPPYKNEHYLYRAMAEHKKDEAVDWSIIWEKMAGYDTVPDKPEAKKEDWHTVYDAMNALNNRIKETINTDDNLFTWKEKTIRRNY